MVHLPQLHSQKLATRAELPRDVTNIVKSSPVVTPSTSGPLGNRWVFLGDSITSGGTQNSTTFQSNDWPLWASVLSGQRIWMVRNAGTGGDTTAMMLDRFDTDVTPFRPSVVSLLAGTNDAGQQKSTEEFRSNIQAIHRKCQDIGAALVLCTIMPTNDDATNVTRIEWNHWLVRYAAENGLHLFDFYGLMVDPATGHLRANDTEDGVHPVNSARHTMGKAFADVMTPLTRQFSLPLVADAADTTSAPYSGNLLLTEDSDFNGIPDGWGAYGGTTGWAHRLVDNPYGPGKMAQVELKNADGMRVLQRSIEGTAWEVGDRLAFMGVLSTTGGTSTTVQMKFINGDSPSAMTPVRLVDGPLEGGVFYYEAPVPANTTKINTELVVQAGTCTASIAQFTVLNLTRLGLE